MDLASFALTLLLVQSATAGFGKERAQGQGQGQGQQTGSHELSAPRYRVVVSVSQCKLRIFHRTDEVGLQPVKEYVVGTASRALDEAPLGKGTIVDIELNPAWNPTDYTRTIYRQKGIELPRVVPPGAPLNYMGSFKIILSHKTSHGAVYRIHGNNDPARVGKRITGGCICMKNDEGLELAAMLSVGTEVDITP